MNPDELSTLLRAIADHVADCRNELELITNQLHAIARITEHTPSPDVS